MVSRDINIKNVEIIDELDYAKLNEIEKLAELLKKPIRSLFTSDDTKKDVNFAKMSWARIPNFIELLKKTQTSELDTYLDNITLNIKDSFIDYTFEDKNGDINLHKKINCNYKVNRHIDKIQIRAYNYYYYATIDIILPLKYLEYVDMKVNLILMVK